MAVVPFGGGTSVVGGVDPARGRFERLISLDLGRLRVDVSVDHRSLTATLGPGLRGPEAEAALASEGVTLGHFPQSFEYATIGGFAATRSAGQASSGYGRFDALVTSIALAAPAGELRTLETPHSAAGPALRELIVGSEGALGVITEVEARVQAGAGAAPLRGLDGGRLRIGEPRSCGRSPRRERFPDVVRVSDRTETRISLMLSGSQGAKRALASAYLRLRGRADGAVVIFGWDGDRDSVARRRALATRRLRAAGAAPLGASPGRAWERGRYEGPYLRDELLDLGYMAETLETAHDVEPPHRALREGPVGDRERAFEPGHAGARDVPPLARLPGRRVALLHVPGPATTGEELEQWRAVKTAACEAIIEAGGTITHHHGVGRDHLPYMRRGDRRAGRSRPSAPPRSDSTRPGS